MRRSLALTDESSRHPFRASLPPHVCLPVEDAAAEGGEALDDADMQSEPVEPSTFLQSRVKWPFTAQEVKEFLLAYCACFMAVSLFIA